MGDKPRKKRKAQARLEARQQDYDKTIINLKSRTNYSEGSYHKPGSNNK